MIVVIILLYPVTNLCHSVLTPLSATVPLHQFEQMYCGANLGHCIVAPIWVIVLLHQNGSLYCGTNFGHSVTVQIGPLFHGTNFCHGFTVQNLVHCIMPPIWVTICWSMAPIWAIIYCHHLGHCIMALIGSCVL